MIPISQDYLNNVFARRRKVKGRIEIQWTNDQDLDSIIISTSQKGYISFEEQIINPEPEEIKKWFTLDPYTKLDNSFKVLPYENSEFEIGWYSRDVSDNEGNFSVYPEITLDFISRPFISIKVVGDLAKNEYPVDFDFIFYNEQNEIVHTESIIGNIAVSYQAMLSVTLKNITKTKLKIKKWSHGNVSSKITKINSDIISIYDDNDILYIGLVEESEVSNATLPIGNISSNELTIRINNIHNLYHPGNENSVLYGLVKKNRKIKAWIGIELEDRTVEYIQLGVFWSEDWNILDDTTFAETKGRDILNRMLETTFRTSEIIYDTNLFELAEMVLKDFGLRSKEYIIDESLKDFIIPYGWFNEVSHREAIRKIASAGICRVYATRQGKIKISKF